MDWYGLFAVTMNPLELVLRGTLMYWFLFLLFRFPMRREVGAVGVADILLLVLVADAAQNGMDGGYSSLSEGAMLVATILGWSWLIDWASFRFPVVARFTVPRPVVLVRNGRVVPGNLRREHLSRDELAGKLRQHGIEDLVDVKVARMESDGQISVTRFSTGEEQDQGARGGHGAPGQ